MLSLPSLLPLIFTVSVHLQAVSADASFPGVLATGTMGPTNPPQPTLGTAVNQSSDARLLTINSIDDFCYFAPPSMANISDTETFEVAYCTKPRNNARLVPDHTFTGVRFLKTDFYVQIIGYGDFTNTNIPQGDEGGELDPHGATGAGNPVGGNVTSNITGSDQNYGEWMQYISDSMLCLRVCTNGNSTFSPANMCWHELDMMGCEFVMPGDYAINGTFETCDADVAEPPGWYPTATNNGTTLFSTFAQYFTGEISGTPYTVGDTVTPTTAYFTPSSSNCVSVPTISNGVALAAVSGTGSTASSAATATGKVTGSRSGSAASSTATGGTSTTGSPSSAVQASAWPGVTLVMVMAGAAAVMLIY